MPGMMSSQKNRSVNNVDSPTFDDGFWQHRRFKGNRQAGAATGGRGWRRVLRKKEKNAFQKDLRSNEM